MSLKVASFNCNSIRKNVEIVKNLLHDNDIVLLQEIIITYSEIDFLNRINDEFHCSFVPSFDPTLNGLNGRPKGGLCIFWRISLNDIIKSTPYTDNIMGVKIGNSNFSILLLNVYMPHDDRSALSLLDFRDVCAQLHDIALSETVEKVIIVGDFNADPFKGRFWNELKHFVDELNFIIADYNVLPTESFSYLSPAHSTTSWLDHVLTSDSNLVSDIKILYGDTIFDHIPISFSLILPNYKEKVIFPKKETNIDKNEFILWNKMTELEIASYNEKIKGFLDEYNNEALYCNQINCNCESHLDLLQDAYTFLLRMLKKASCDFTIQNKNSHKKVVPGWNVHCRELHAIARSKFLIWKDTGKLRAGPDYENMKNSRAEFKNALNRCKANENEIRRENLAKSFALKDKSCFWKDVKKLKPKSDSTFHNVDNKNDPKEIAELFSEKYKIIFYDNNCQIKDTDYPQKINLLNNKLSTSKYVIHNFSVLQSIKSINHCIDIEGLHSNHFKMASKVLSRFLAKLFSSFVHHGYIPNEMLRGVIKPIVKNNLGNLNDSNNYRPITISSNCLKLFEGCISAHLDNSLPSNHRQFGFQTNASTIMATSLLKETINSYVKKGSSVYVAFVDLKKAFDKVNHSKLIGKLIDSKLSPCVTNILKYIYSNQYVSVCYENSHSSSWLLGNGVRQGSLISPRLFNFYINEVLEKLNNLNVGCKLGIRRHNSQGYADDLSVMAPSAYALQFLLDQLVIMLDNLNLLISTEKSCCMVFRSKNVRHCLNPTFKLKNEILNIVNSYKYLGIVIRSNLSNVEDIKKCNLSFTRQFFSMFRKFNFADTNVLKFLFYSHCMSFYGVELWSSRKGCSEVFNNLEINYHKFIKIIANVPTYARNHVICRMIGLPIFKYFINLKIIRFAFNFFNSSSKSFLPYKCYYKNFSVFKNEITDLFKKEYGIEAHE